MVFHGFPWFSWFLQSAAPRPSGRSSSMAFRLGRSELKASKQLEMVWVEKGVFSWCFFGMFCVFFFFFVFLDVFGVFPWILNLFGAFSSVLAFVFGFGVSWVFFGVFCDFLGF